MGSALVEVLEAYKNKTKLTAIKKAPKVAAFEALKVNQSAKTDNKIIRSL